MFWHCSGRIAVHSEEILPGIGAYEADKALMLFTAGEFLIFFLE
jgi:hypothetical protein